MLYNSDDNDSRLFGSDASDSPKKNNDEVNDKPKLFNSSYTNDSSKSDDSSDDEFESFAISFKANDPASSVSEKLKSEMNGQQNNNINNSNVSDDFDEFSDFKIDSSVSAFKPVDNTQNNNNPSVASMNSGLDFPETSDVTEKKSSVSNEFEDEFDSFVPDESFNPFKAKSAGIPTVSGKVNNTKPKSNLDFPVDEFNVPDDNNSKKDDNFKPESFGKISSGVNAFAKKNSTNKNKSSDIIEESKNEEVQNKPMTELKSSDKAFTTKDNEEIIASISTEDDPGSISPFKRINEVPDTAIPASSKNTVSGSNSTIDNAQPKVESKPQDNKSNVDNKKPLARPAISKPVPGSTQVKSRPGTVEAKTKNKAPAVAPVTPVASNKKKHKNSTKSDDSNPGIKGIIVLLCVLAVLLFSLVIYEKWDDISAKLNISKPEATTQETVITAASTEDTTEVTTEEVTTTEATTVETTTKATTAATTTEATTVETTTAATTTEETTEATTVETTTVATTTEATTVETTTVSTTTEETTVATTTTEATTTTTEATTTEATTKETTKSTSASDAPVLTFYQSIKNTKITDNGFDFDFCLENYGPRDAVLSDSLKSITIRLKSSSTITGISSDYFTFTDNGDNTYVATPKAGIKIAAGETLYATISVTTESKVTSYGITSYYFDWNS
ncbi:MAG: hypothetical protein MJ153_04580 [Clostridia bacterium]|nr:hypothetical protein [Clostridia bacterium]